jgi:hypothetical protein
MNLKRNTSYLLDVSAIAASLSATRQPAQTARLIVELVGNTVLASGRVTIFASSSSAVAQYVVTDRVTGTKYAIKSSDGVINITSTASAASAEPIVEDNLLSGVYWKIFVSDGVIGIESTGTVQNDAIVLDDTVTGTDYLIVVSDGVLGLGTPANSTSEVFTFSENTEKAGVINFSSIAGITTSGITNGFINVRAVTKMGQPINQIISVQDNVPVRFYKQHGRIKLVKQGDELVSEYKIMAEPNLDIRDEDLVYPLSDVVGLTLGLVNFVERIWDFDGLTHHTEAVLVDL